MCCRLIPSDLTKHVCLLEVHVHNASRPDTRHLLAVQSTDLSEETRTGSVATIFGEKDGDVVLLELLGSDVKARLLERRVTAPRVDVVAPKVDGGLLVTTIKVRGQVGTDISVVVGGIADTNLTVVLALDVGLGVADSRLDKSASHGVVGLVGNLVASEETHGVVVLHQLINHARVALIGLGCPSWVVSDDRVSRLRQVCNDVDASISEGVHACLVVRGRVDGVDTDGVCLDLLEVLDITLARRRVGEGVDDLELAIDRLCGVCVDPLLVGDTLHETKSRSAGIRDKTIKVYSQLCAILVEELLALRRVSKTVARLLWYCLP
jgi:hypothetical protein